MPKVRKEPIISPSALDLTDRVKLTWREVRDLSDKSETKPVPVKKEEPKADSILSRKLSEAEMAEIAAMIAPAVEDALLRAMRDALELSLANAGTRIRTDLERSLSGIIDETIKKEVAKIDLKDK